MMNYLASTSRNIHFSVGNTDHSKDKLTPLLELIITHYDGKKIEFVENQMVRKQKFSECRVLLEREQIDDLIEYLEDCKQDMDNQKERSFEKIINSSIKNHQS